jgi:hypothetical protein
MFGVTVLTPEVGTSPKPSIDTDAASVVRQVNCTWSPAVITLGVAVSCAVGAGTVAGGGASWGGGNAAFFLHPETAIKDASRTTGTRIRLRIFNLVLLPKNSKSSSGRLGLMISLRSRRTAMPPLSGSTGRRIQATIKS